MESAGCRVIYQMNCRAPVNHKTFIAKSRIIMTDGKYFNFIIYTTTEHGYSNTSLCYYKSIKVLLYPLVTHLVSVPIFNVTIVWATRTQVICSFTSKKVLLLCNTIYYLLDHLSNDTIILYVPHFFSSSNTITLW